jgi:hypothetical protein
MTRRTITKGSAIAAFAMTGGLAAPAAGAVSSDASCVGQHAGTVAPIVGKDFGAVISGLAQAGVIGDLTPFVARAATDACPSL